MQYTSTGRAVLNFSVAVLENRPGGDGAALQWVRIAAWEELAEDLAERLQKGDEVYVEGRLSLNTWLGRDGEQHTSVNVSAWLVQPLGHIGRRALKRPAPERMTQWDALPSQGDRLVEQT